MSKQVKIGFDKIPAPKVERFEPLYDLVTGTPLTDGSGIPLVTLESSALELFNTKDNSMPVVVNNVNNDQFRETIKIEEQFPTFSEVSSSLLGVERAETQLSLFSDVSSYGLDDSSWEYRTSGTTPNPTTWYEREHPQYGYRYRTKFAEETREQALYLSSFPVQFTYPWPPGTIQHDAVNYPKYLNFIIIGKILWHLYDNQGYTNFANANFIPPFITVEDAGGADLQFINVAQNNALNIYIQANGNLVNTGAAYKVDYGLFEQDAFNQVEKWTIAYFKILDDALGYPDQGFQSTDEVINIVNGVKSSQTNEVTPARPGYSSSQTMYATLQSKKSFRYQPGRISGFTFGLRGVTNPEIVNNSIEWGCSNTTDEYMFQLKGPNLSIVRRSTIPLPPELLERMGLNERDQTASPIFVSGLDNTEPLYECVIPRDKWTNDRLDGTGESGYNIDITRVTMYKVEFGWYGAIGAQFYAYVPVDNDECRWVLLHRITIENGIDRPCLENPNFRFKYLVNVQNTDKMYEPVYLYKYGASYYIDGGDQGTSVINNGASEKKEFRANSPTIAIFPKDVITNSFGAQIVNDKKIYLEDLSAFSSEVSEIRLQEIVGSPEGQHFHYSPSLKSGISPGSSLVNMRVSANRQDLSIPAQDYTLTAADDEKKVIAPFLYNTYIGFDDDDFECKIKRRLNYNMSERALNEQVITPTVIAGVSRNILGPMSGYEFQARLSGYDTVVASTIPLSSNFFKIHFLNPNAGDIHGQYSEFALALTNKQPRMVDVTTLQPEDLTAIETAEVANAGSPLTEVLRFGAANEIFNVYDEAYAEFSQLQEFQSATLPYDTSPAVSTNGLRFELDSNLPEPDGEDSGKISGIIGKVEIIDYIISEDVAQDPDDATGYVYRVYFDDVQAAPRFSLRDINEGTVELGIDDERTGIIVTSELIEENTNEVDPLGNIIYDYYFTVDTTNALAGKIDLINAQGIIQTKLIILQNNFRIDTVDEDGNSIFQEQTVNVAKAGSFDIQPLYVVFALRDNAQINNIVIEEVRPTGNTTFTPQWITSSRTYTEANSQGTLVEPIVLSGGSSLDLQPSDFEDVSPQSAAKLDFQVTQPLRPPKRNLLSVFVSSNEAQKINLKQFFGEDRIAITPSRSNNVGYFLTAQTLITVPGDPPTRTPPGDIELSITLREQI